MYNLYEMNEERTKNMTERLKDYVKNGRTTYGTLQKNYTDYQETKAWILE